MSDQTILITGATDGLGRALAAELAATGATALAPWPRRRARLGETIEQIGAQTGNERLYWHRADLASLAEVRGWPRRSRATTNVSTCSSTTRASAPTCPAAWRAESADGHELRFAVNYLAGFLLTAAAAARARALGAGPDRQRRVGRPGADRLRRRDARALLQRRPGLLPEQARAGHVHVRPRRASCAIAASRSNCLHPATYMPTKMVRGRGVHPVTRSRRAWRRRDGWSPTRAGRRHRPLLRRPRGGASAPPGL